MLRTCTVSNLCPVEIGEYVKQDELVANIETDKVTIPVNCPESGLLKELFAKEGDTVEVGSNLFKIDPDAKAPEALAKEKTKAPASAPGAPAAPSFDARSLLDN